MTPKQLYKQAREIAGEMTWQEIYNGIDDIQSKAEDRIATHKDDELEYYKETIINMLCDD